MRRLWLMEANGWSIPTTRASAARQETGDRGQGTGVSGQGSPSRESRHSGRPLARSAGCGYGIGFVRLAVGPLERGDHSGSDLLAQRFQMGEALKTGGDGLFFQVMLVSSNRTKMESRLPPALKQGANARNPSYLTALPACLSRASFVKSLRAARFKAGTMPWRQYPGERPARS